MVTQHVTTAVQFSYAHRDALFNVVTASQCKITRHDAHMKFELGWFNIHDDINRNLWVTSVS